MLGNKEVMSYNIKRLLKQTGKSRQQVSNEMGISYVTLSGWINKISYPRIDSIEKMADYFEVNKSDLIEKPNHEYNDRFINVFEIPILSKISAGMPDEEMDDYIIGWTSIPDNKLDADRDLFALQVNGDSMDQLFNDGDIIVVDKNAVVENGQLAVVQVNGYNSTVKQVKYKDNQIILLPLSNNSEHVPQVYTSNDNVTIIGKVVSSQKFY